MSDDNYWIEQRKADRENAVDSLLPQLALIKQHLDMHWDDIVWVSHYNHTRKCGGPEEGGWYYENKELDSVIGFATHEAAEAFFNRVKAQDLPGSYYNIESWENLGIMHDVLHYTYE